jgi:hypothetical protein
MKLCGLNCRGLRNPRAVCALLDLEKHLKPDVFFLSKTHLDKVRAENLRRKLGFDHSIIFKSDGQSGDLLMFWRDNVRTSIKGVTKNYIDVVIEGDFSWRFTGVYGEPSWVRNILHGMLYEHYTVR